MKFSNYADLETRERENKLRKNHLGKTKENQTIEKQQASSKQTQNYITIFKTVYLSLWSIKISELREMQGI